MVFEKRALHSPMFPSIEMRLILFSMESFSESFIDSGHGLLGTTGIFQQVNTVLLFLSLSKKDVAAAACRLLVVVSSLALSDQEGEVDASPPRKQQLLLGEAPAEQPAYLKTNHRTISSNKILPNTLPKARYPVKVSLSKSKQQ